MKKILNPLLFLHFLNDGVRTTFIILLPFIAKDLFLSYTQVGFLGSSQGLLSVILAFPTGFIASKIGGFKLLTVALFIYSLGALGISVAPNILFLFPIFYLGAIGFGMFHIIGFSLVAKESEKGNIGRNMANFTSIGDVGRISISTLALFLTSIIGWHLTITVIGIIGCIIFILSRLYGLRNEKHVTEKAIIQESNREWLKNLYHIFKTKRLLLVSSVALLDTFASSQLFLFLPFLLLQRGVNAAILGIFTGGYFIGNFSGKTLLGRGVDKYGNKKVFIISELLMAFIIILIAVTNNLVFLFVLSFLLGVFTKGTSPVIQTLFSEEIHKTHYEKVFAISESFIGVASVIAPIIMGVFADHFGILSVFYLSAFFAIFSIFPVFLIPRKLNRIDLQG